MAKQKIQQIPIDDQPDSDAKLDTAISEAHRVIKTVIGKTEDSWIRDQIVKAKNATASQLNTQEFRRYAFRQGAACEFPELNDNEKDQPKDAAKDDEQEQDDESDRSKAS